MSESEPGVGPHDAGSSEKKDARTKFSWLDFLKIVALPAVTLILGFAFNSSLDARHTEDSNVRLYAEMMGRREQADSDLRKDMFKSILDTFMSKEEKLDEVHDLRQKVLNLELLAYNFHESLDIGPLFKDVRRQVSDRKAGPDSDLLKRLEKVSREVIERQLTALSDGGTFDRGDANPEYAGDLRAFLYFGSHVVQDPNFKQGEGVSHVCLWTDLANGEKRERRYRQFTLEILTVDAGTREVQVRLGVSEPLQAAECQKPDLRATIEIDTTFWVGLFDFPMIDNTRLTHGERAAVSLLELGPGVLNVSLAYFPGSRASLKDKPYYEDVVRKLLRRGSPSEASEQRP